MKNTEKLLLVGAICLCLTITAFSITKAAVSTFQDGIVIGGTSLTTGLLLEVEGKAGFQQLCNEAGAECSDVTNIYNLVQAGSGGIAGSGTTGFIPIFTAPTTVGDSIIQQSGTNIGLGRVPAQRLDVNGNIIARSGHIYFGSGAAQDLYGDNSTALYFDSNNSGQTQLIMRDAENTTYGRLFGNGDGTYFGLLDGDGHWAVMHQKDVATEFRIDNISKMYLNNDNLYLSGQQMQIGWNKTGNRLAYTDYVGDDTYTDYGLRVIRSNGGPNTDSGIHHRGTGGLYLSAIDAGRVVFRTNNTDRVVVMPNTGAVGIGDSAPDSDLLLDVEGKVGATEYCNQDGQWCESQPLYFEVNAGSQTSAYQCIHDIDLESHCGDADGCQITINMNYKTQANDQVHTISEHIYMEEASFSNSNDALVYGWTRQEGGGDYAWTTGAGSGRETMFNPWSWIWMLDYKSTSCGGDNSIYSDPYTFTFQANPAIRAKIFVYDRP